MKENEILEDAILLDFLRKGENNEYELPDGFEWKTSHGIREFLTNPKTLGEILVGATLAALIWLVFPSSAAPLPTGAWLPLIAFVAGALALVLGDFVWRSGYLSQTCRCRPDLRLELNRRPAKMPHPMTNQSPRGKGSHKIPIPETVDISRWYVPDGVARGR